MPHIIYDKTMQVFFSSL